MRIWTCVVVLALLTPASGSAQQATVDDFRAIASKITTESKIFPLMRDATNEAKQASPEPSLTFLASNDGTVAKARFAYLVADVASLEALVSGPVRGGTANLATESHLGGGVSFSGQLTLVLSRRTSGTAIQKPPSAAEPTMANAAALGPGQSLAFTPFSAVARQQSFQQLGLVKDSGAAPTFDDLVNASIKIGAAMQAAGGASLVRHTARLAPLQTMLALPTVAAAAGQSPEILAATLSGEAGREAFATAFRFLANDMNLWKVDRAWLLTLSGTAGRPTFTVADTATSKFSSVTEDSRGGSISLGTVITRARSDQSEGFYFGGSYEEGTTFSGSPKNYCLPTGDALLCQNAVAAEPSGQKTRLISGDARWYFKKLTMAVTARPSYDRETKERIFAFPIYFLQNSKDMQSALADDKAGLNGGINFGWRKTPTTNSEFFAVFFVGSVFRLPGVPH